MAGTSICEIVIAGMPAWIKSSNGFNSSFSSSSILFFNSGNARCESVSVSPCPGKCFPEQRIPAFVYPLTAHFAHSVTVSAFSPKLRIPITGFFRFVLMSKTGARLKLIPRAFNSSPTIREPFSSRSLQCA